MTFLLQIVRLFVVMLFSALGASMAFAFPTTTSEISFHQTEKAIWADVTDVGFAAPAPPVNGQNVAITGGVTGLQCSAFALHGQETVAALFGFDASFDATNTTVGRGLDDVPDGLATPSTVRNDLDDFIKGTDPDRPVCVATAEVTVNGETQRFVSVS